MTTKIYSTTELRHQISHLAGPQQWAVAGRPAETYDGDAVVSILAQILDAAGPRWRGVQRLARQGAVELFLLLGAKGDYHELAVTVTRSARLSSVRMRDGRTSHAPRRTRILTTNRSGVWGFSDENPAPKSSGFLDYTIAWLAEANATVDDLIFTRHRIAETREYLRQAAQKAVCLTEQLEATHARQAELRAELSKLYAALSRHGLADPLHQDN
ncbi:hypothetical protein C5E45_20570 [Nocardia nova]|uniref:Uncharacterized protein n=1 Tax=Nocardia nova TaxID=37330 RepID=A0A2S6AMH3_9NOCA|nr:hypothetical protein [Nocardia nova]PPJ36441.1 hypothetical protein C5E45_20570 [Nocardia nova]